MKWSKSFNGGRNNRSSLGSWSDHTENATEKRNGVSFSDIRERHVAFMDCIKLYQPCHRIVSGVYRIGDTAAMNGVPKQDGVGEY